MKRNFIDINKNLIRYLDGSKKAYFREFKKILETADVVLDVLDARDPLGSRCPDIEKKIIAKDPNKKIILVLNKIGMLLSFSWNFNRKVNIRTTIKTFFKEFSLNFLKTLMNHNFVFSLFFS